MFLFITILGIIWFLTPAIENWIRNSTKYPTNGL